MPYPSLKPLAIVGLAVLLGGCGSLIEQPYQRPALNLPAHWQEIAKNQTRAGGQWWKAFNDPQLERLIEQALVRNNDLGTALLNIRLARLQARLTANDQWPQASASLGSSHSRNLRGDNTGINRNYSANASVSWDADLWNRLGSASDAAELEAKATEQDFAATRLSLIGSVATLYWQIAYLNERLRSSADSIDYARETLALVQVQYDAGQAGALELAEARQSLESQLAAQVELRQQQVEQRNALAVLFDGVEPVLNDEPQQLRKGTLPAVDAGLPASLLARRPDLQAAETRLRATLKSADATRASYYPDLSLTGTLGYSSLALGNLLQNPVAALGTGLSLPFLQYRQMQLNIEASKVDYELAVVSFRQTLYQALADVQNNLAARRHYAEQAGMRERALASAQEAERIYKVRYEAGAESLQSWLSAQETRRTAETTLAQNRLNQLLNYITLAQALGGEAQEVQ